MSQSDRFPAPGTPHDLEHGHRFTPKFDAEGLIPAIVTDAGDGTVLMFAWMNSEALALTLATRKAHFWTRSRKRIWLKGEESGNVLHVEEVRVDCDQDVVLVRARLAGAGVACHTGARSCFYRSVELDRQPSADFALVDVDDAALAGRDHS
jgi:phosphoribosyl-AMP cyclohydrolase